jgi:hypothetical protein
MKIFLEKDKKETNSESKRKEWKIEKEIFD